VLRGEQYVPEGLRSMLIEQADAMRPEGRTIYLSTSGHNDANGVYGEFKMEYVKSVQANETPEPRARRGR